MGHRITSRFTNQGLAIAILLPIIAHGCCPNQCGGHGHCGSSSNHQCTCTCFESFTGADCSLRRCPKAKAWVGYSDSSGLQHSELVECSGVGDCDRSNGACKCQAGFEGMACERLSCPNRCSQHGQCITLEQAASMRDDTSFFRETTYTLWDRERVMGCVCDVGWAGYDCKTRVCPSGDDPVTTGQVDEVQVIDCTCAATCSGVVYLSYGPHSTDGIAYDATALEVKQALEALPNIASVTVTMAGGSILCSDPVVSTAVTFTHNSGDLTNVRLSTGTLASTGSAPSLILIHSGQTSGNSVVSVTGTKENYECNGRGVCDQGSGLCGCYNYNALSKFSSSDGSGSEPPVKGAAGDCGYIPDASDITRCPGTTSCSGHGTCSDSPHYLCACFEGWNGKDCATRQCAFGKAWFAEPGHTLPGFVSVTNGAVAVTTTVDLRLEIKRGDTIYIDGIVATVSTDETTIFTDTALTLASAYSGTTVDYATAYKNPNDAHYLVECSNRGKCQTGNGECECLEGFGGPACDRILCKDNCNDHGTCEPLWRLAELTSDSNGEATSYTYGQTLGDVSTWDFDMLYGCHCDARTYSGAMYGFTGISCAMRTCPYGKDTSSNFETSISEQQTFMCTGTSGTFMLTFRQDTTGPIKFDASATEVEAALEALDTLGDVDVSFSCGTSACNSGGVTITVTFVGNGGDVPSLSSTSSTLQVASHNESVVATTTKEVECSNHGICSRTSGLCKCSMGYFGIACDQRTANTLRVNVVPTTAPPPC